MRKTMLLILLALIVCAGLPSVADAQAKTVLDYPKSWTGNFETSYMLVNGKHTATDTLSYLRILPGAVALTLYFEIDTVSTADTAHYYIDVRSNEFTSGQAERWTTIDSVKTVYATGTQRKTLTSVDALYRIRRLFTAGSVSPSFHERVIAAIKQNY